MTAAEIRAVAKQLFRPNAMAAAIIGPFDKRATVEKMFRLA